MQTTETIIVPRKLIERAAQCIARAEVEGAYKDCALPAIGKRTLAWLETHICD